MDGKCNDALVNDGRSIHDFFWRDYLSNFIRNGFFRDNFGFYQTIVFLNCFIGLGLFPQFCIPLFIYLF